MKQIRPEYLVEYQTIIEDNNLSAVYPTYQIIVSADSEEEAIEKVQNLHRVRDARIANMQARQLSDGELMSLCKLFLYTYDIPNQRGKLTFA